MTNASSLFKTAADLEADGYYRVDGNRYRRGKDIYVPLYEGKMVQAYDHRAANVVVDPTNLNRPAQPQPATAEQHADPDWLPNPQFWVRASGVPWPEVKNSWLNERIDWAVGFKDVTSPTNVRTMIAAIVPFAGYGNTLPLLLPRIPDGIHDFWKNKAALEEDTMFVSSAFDFYRRLVPLWVANLNSFAYDFVARQKVQGQHLNWYIVEQIPVLTEEHYETKFGRRKACDIVRDMVLKLTYTSHDLAPFAEDMGYGGKPFPWDEDERRHNLARLDALFFLLYGISPEDASYILDTFPIVKREDEAAFGRYRTKDLVLAYMKALAAGDTESRVSVAERSGKPSDRRGKKRART